MASFVVRLVRTILSAVWLFLLRPLGMFIITGGVITLFRYLLSAWGMADSNYDLL